MNIINSCSASDLADYLLQIGAIDSYEEYALVVLEMGYFKLSQELANQPVDVPDAWDLLAWAESRA